MVKNLSVEVFNWVKIGSHVSGPFVSSVDRYLGAGTYIIFYTIKKRVEYQIDTPQTVQLLVNELISIRNGQ